MPKDGFYFDAIPRQEPINDDSLDPADNLEEFTRLSDSEIQEMVNAAKEIQAEDKGIVLALPGTGFGDIALVPAVWRKQTRGIRDIEEWYISTALRPDYVRTVFEGQLEVAIQNLEKLMPALGPFADAAFITGTDFGTQNGPFISPKTYRDLYKPFHKTINDTIHRHTNWKTFIHSCGSVVELIPDFIDAGFDILNPVQISAAGMEARELVKHFGKDIVFWGGGVDTQKTLPFGTPEEVYRQVRERIDIFNPGGGFVFNTIHNIQATTPLENMLAMIRAIQDSGKA
jgi:uroporphyrinogen-III decarboxylase